MKPRRAAPSVRRFRDVADELVMAVCERYLDSERSGGAARIADELNRSWRRQGIDYAINREQVYPLLAEARTRNFFSFTPPVDAALGRQVAERFGASKNHVRVVAARDSVERVAEAAAELAVELIQEIGQRKGRRERVHVGLGAGWTSRAIAQNMAQQLRNQDYVPKLTLHAMTSGFDVTRPWTAPVAFFNLFDDPGRDIEYVGLFAPAFVRTRQYAATQAEPGVKESFKVARRIDLVITSLASESDPHSDLMRFMTLGGRRKDALDKLRRHDWVGDLQYRPYSERAPILADVGLRAVTLFEIDDLVEMARREKHVLLVSGPCGECLQTRVQALRPLLEEDRLRAWSHLVLDLPTAAELLEEPRSLGRRRGLG